MTKKIPGLVLVTSLSGLAILINHFLNLSLSFLALETLTLGILLGMLLTNTLGVHNHFMPGITYALKTILKWGIVLLGVKLNFNVLITLGPKSLLLILFMVGFALCFSYFLGKKFKLSTPLSLLIGVGSSICGASAIVAMAPVLQAEDDDTTLSVTIISLLGAIGVILYTLAARLSSMSDAAFGLWSGLSLQGVAHALAAAGARGDASLEIGTLVKMARVALLWPMALLLGSMFGKSQEKKRVNFPKYVLYFLLVALLFSFNDRYNFMPTHLYFGHYSIHIIGWLKELSNFFILMAMVAMGLSANISDIKGKALNALKASSALFIIISITSLLLVFVLIRV